MNYNWDWLIFLQPSLTGEGLYGVLLLRGLFWTLAISSLSWVLAVALATVVGVVRTLPIPVLPLLGAVFVNVFRNIPLLVQLFLWYFVVPELLPQEWGRAIKRMDPLLNQYLTVVVGLTLYTAAKASEHIRSGIETVTVGQKQAGSALGLTTIQAYRYVILPQALRIVIPPMTSDFLNVFKNSSVALTIGLLELAGATYQLSEFSAQPFEFFAAATLIYMAITYSVILLMRVVERRTRIAGSLGASA
ncbi:amino acid ABC transporter permease [Nitratireductor sp.]|uniref:amino acid ABC transporter permease n=1 Tax=Nitratireductor sp. TaxID=1872084 RepID=UPI0026348815|nr:amino acid ABC transporter permease [Nitratireductor sp.]MCV0378342.1 amino acid ABC transporter permease [Nitratireductor sp.]